MTSEHERFSADQIVVKCTLRAAFGVPDEHGVGEGDRAAAPDERVGGGSMARSRPTSATLRSRGSDSVRRTVGGMPITMTKPPPMPCMDVPNMSTMMKGGPGPTGAKGVTQTARRTDEGTW